MGFLPAFDLGGILLALSAALRYIIIALLCVVALGAAKDFLTSNKAVADIVSRLAPGTSSKRAPGTSKADGGRKLRRSLGSSRDDLDVVVGGSGREDDSNAASIVGAGAELGDGGAFDFVDNLGSSRKYGGGGFSVL